MNKQDRNNLIKSSNNISEKVQVNSKSVYKILKENYNKTWQNIAIQLYCDETNPINISNIAKEVKQSRQTVHNFLKRTIPESERNRIKSVKSSLRKADNLEKDREVLHAYNRINIKKVNKAGVIIGEDNEKYYNIVLKGQPTTLYYNKTNRIFCKKHRTNSHCTNENSSLFFISSESITYKNITMSASEISKFFNKITSKYEIL